MPENTETLLAFFTNSPNPFVSHTVSSSETDGWVPDNKLSLVLRLKGMQVSEFADIDSDGVIDTLDNCAMTSNFLQSDHDSDGYGNLCDAYFNGDCSVNFIDYSSLTSQFLYQGFAFEDLNNDYIINFQDIALFGQLFLREPGPSGLTTQCSNQ